MVDHVEAGTVDYIDDLDPTIPQESGTQVAYGNDNIRNLKKAVQQSFPNVAGAVTADHTELSYVDGVTSAIQTQLNNIKVSGLLDKLVVDTDVLVVDATNDRVGIGTANPADLLHVYDAGFYDVLFESASIGGATRLEIKNTAGSAFLGIQTSGKAWLHASSVDLVIGTDTDSDGLIYLDHTNQRMGLGTATPQNLLHVYETSAINVLFESGTSVGSSRLQYKNSSGSAYLGVQTSGKGWLHADSADLVIGTDTSSNGLIYLDHSGTNVGIGTATPHASSKLDVNGAIYQRGAELYADYVFSEGYELANIMAHHDEMWTKKRLPAMPESLRDEAGKDILDMGRSYRGIVEELELAHIYIAELCERINHLEYRVIG